MIKEKKINMKSILLPLLSITALFLNACGMNMLIGSGKIIQETRVVQNFNKVVLSIPARLVLTQNDSESLDISADDNFLPYIQTKVENGILSIYVEPEFTNLNPSEEILITLSAKAIQALTVNGSGEIESEELTAEELSLTINGSGEIKVGQIEAEQFKASINGSGEMKFDTTMTQTTNLRIDGSGKYVLSGKTVEATLLINGSGKILAQGLECQDVQTNINGSGNVSIWASEHLNVSITGSGHVGYRGQGKISQTIIGSGSIYQE